VNVFVNLFDLGLGLWDGCWRRRLLRRWRWGRSSDIFGGLGSFRLLLVTSPSRARRRGRLELFDKVAREDAFLLHAMVVEVFPAIPVVVLLIGDGDDLPNTKVQVILMRGRVLVKGLDLERCSHVDGDP
jgi:hypothetical protein